jgi:hypothetical protein
VVFDSHGEDFGMFDQVDFRAGWHYDLLW